MKTLADEQTVVQLQRRFSALIRNEAPLDLDPGMRVYVDAYSARLRRALGEDFPVLAAVLGESGFSELMFGFLKSSEVGVSHYASLAELGKSFLNYLNHWESHKDFQALRELAHYEWMKVLCSLAPEDSFDARNFG
jgi:hypothetical protein